MSEGAAAWQVARAPAKVNLSLEVLARRADGYHELDTLMLCVDLADVLRARRVERPGLALRVGGAAAAGVPADERNLAWRAAQAVLARAQRRAGKLLGLELALEKHVPSGAGLGGASSDAAAAVLAAQAALECELARDEQQELLASLGSDCPFFLASPSGLARCTGRGERVEPLGRAPPAWWILLLTPDVSCPTAQVYSAVRPPLCRPAGLPSLGPQTLDLPAREARGGLFNGLEGAALRSVPGLRAWKDALSRCGAEHWKLSGSGSTFYGLHDDREEALAELDRLRAELGRSGLRPRLATAVRPAGRGAALVPPESGARA